MRATNLLTTIQQANAHGQRVSILFLPSLSSCHRCDGPSGNRRMQRLIQSLESKSSLAIYPITPHREQVLGIASLKRIGGYPGGVDLVIVELLPRLSTDHRECVDAGISSAVLSLQAFVSVARRCRT